MPHARFVQRDMTNVEFRASLMNLTQLMTAQAHVVNNHFVAHTNRLDRPQQNSSTPTSRIQISR